jgi:hypothetical protein
MSPETLTENEAGHPILELGGWHQLTGVYDGTSIRIYFDGTLRTDKETGVDPNAELLVDPRIHIRISASAYRPNWFDMHTAGWIDDVLIFNRALPSDEVKDLFVASS